MSSAKVAQARFPAVGEEALAAIQKATREALAEHGKAGQPVPIWRDEKVVWVKLDEEGNIVGDA